MVEPKIKGFSRISHIQLLADHSYGITLLYHRLEPLMWVTTSKAFHYESRKKKRA